jgi:uncharacterized protein (DUF433 family)
VLGRTYKCASGEKFFQPLIKVADRQNAVVSFRNVVELHVLSAIRRRHKVQMPEVRRALVYLSRQLGIAHPLADQKMLTDGTDLLIEQYGRLLNISRNGQLEMKEAIEVYLARVERDPDRLPIRFYPFTRPDITASPKLVVLNPRVQFGKPCIAGTGIPTSIIAERFKAGEDIRALSRDYGQSESKIDEALRFEFASTAA